jgi:Cytochrome c554 and c-prime
LAPHFPQALPVRRTVVLLVALAVVAGLSAGAQGVQHLSITQPGGMPGMPVLTGIQRTTNGVQITWDGPSGYYQIWHKIHLTDSTWLTVGQATNLNRTAGITALYSNDFFRVSGPAPHYAGSQVCTGCHGAVHSTVMLTAHTQAFTNAIFVALGGQTNAACLACHTVGYGLPTGFVSASRTPSLEGVQCESCHGPAANHAANPSDPTVIPRVELAAQVCGGCHSVQLAPAEEVAHHPKSFAFEDWSASPHSAVVPDVLSSMSSSSANISNCGRCHSGSARLALLDGQNPSVTLTHDFDVAITCAVCHDPHAQHVWTNGLSGTLIVTLTETNRVFAFTNALTGRAALITNGASDLVYTNQLRYALSSTNDFHLTTSEPFTNDPNINVCAQCHNDRGAAWMTVTTNNNVTTTNYLTDRAPHHSPQYNMLLGTVGELTTGPTPGYPSTHSRLELQCAECHMQTNSANSDFSGHTFEVASYQLCLNCHGQPAALVQFVTNDIAVQIQLTKSILDLWATNAAPAVLRTNYGTLAWEYTTPGDLSPGGVGPNTFDQTNYIPADIMKARFDLYLVLYDGSYGVHNAPYDIQLLESAQSWIEGQLYQ